MTEVSYELTIDSAHTHDQSTCQTRLKLREATLVFYLRVLVPIGRNTVFVLVVEACPNQHIIAVIKQVLCLLLELLSSLPFK